MQLFNIKNKSKCTLIYYIIFITFFINNVYASSEEELYLKVFGIKKHSHNQSIAAPLLINNRHRGDVQLLLNGKESTTKIKLTELLLNLEPILKVKAMEAIKNDHSEQEDITLPELLKHGITARFDSDKLELHLEIPAEIRKTELIRFRQPNKNLFRDDIIEPANVSAYLNVFAKQDISSLGSPNMVFDGVLNYSNFVLESELFYRPNYSKSLQRGKTRLTHDLLEQSVRISAFDVSLPAIDFQTPTAVGGMVIAKNFRLRPDLTSYPTSQKQFLLEHPSTVEILVNGRSHKTLFLAEGSYDLRDFPVEQGINDILIRIRDEFGREREIAFPFHAETQMLAKNVHEYSYGFGFPSTISKGEYDTRRFLFSGFHRLSLNERFVLGLNAQGDKAQQLLGGSLYFPSRLGDFTFRSALSRSTENEYGFANSLEYIYQRKHDLKVSDRRWDFLATYKTSDFSSTGNIQTSAPIALDIAARVTQKLGENTYLILRGNYQDRYGFDNKTKNISLSLKKNISKNWRWRTTLTHTDSYNKGLENGLEITLNYLFGNTRNSLKTSYNSKNNTKRISLNSRSESIYNGYRLQAEAVKKENSTSLSGNLSHENHRFDASIQSSIYTALNGSGAQTKRTTLSLSSALVYADGHYAISSPITDSFAIVVPHSSLDNLNIGVNRYKDQYEATSGFLGRAVIPNLISYRPKRLMIDIDELPLGYNLDNNIAHVLPTFSSGTVIPLGGDANVALTGVLHTPEGEIAKLEAGELISMNNTDQGAYRFFTSKKGLFFIEGLKPGLYQMQLYSMPEIKLMIEVPKEHVGIYNIGNLSISPN